VFAAIESAQLIYFTLPLWTLFVLESRLRQSDDHSGWQGLILPAMIHARYVPGKVDSKNGKERFFIGQFSRSRLEK
jgi:hypothetical protein